MGRKRLAAASVLLIAAFSCSASQRTFEQGNRAASDESWDLAVAYYERALAESPQKIEYRMALQRASFQASRAHLARARELLLTGDLEGAAEELAIAIEYDPASPYLRSELAEVRGRVEERAEEPEPPRAGAAIRERIFGPEPLLDPSSSAPISLHFAEETSLRTVLETLAKLAGVNILFDESFRDRRVSFELEGVTFREALELLLMTNGLYYKVMDTETVRVAPETR